MALKFQLLYLNTMTNLGRISFISAYNSTLWSITEGCHGRNPNRVRTWQQELMQKPLRSAVYRVSPHGLLVCFLIVLKATRPGVALPRVNLALPYQSSTKKKNAPQAILLGCFLFPNEAILYQVDIKLSCTQMTLSF